MGNVSIHLSNRVLDIYIYIYKASLHCAFVPPLEQPMTSPLLSSAATKPK